MEQGCEPRQVGPESLCFALSDSLQMLKLPRCVLPLVPEWGQPGLFSPTPPVGRNMEGPSLQAFCLYGCAEVGDHRRAFKAEEEAYLETATRMDFEVVLV